MLFFKKSGTVEKVFFDFDVKEHRDDEAEPLKDSETRHRDSYSYSPSFASLRRLQKTGVRAHAVLLDSSSPRVGIYQRNS